MVALHLEPGSLMFTVGYELDEIAEAHGREKVFIPTLNATLDRLGVSQHVDIRLDYAGFLKKTEEAKERIIAKAAIEYDMTKDAVKSALDKAKIEQTLSEQDSDDLVKTIKDID